MTLAHKRRVSLAHGQRLPVLGWSALGTTADSTYGLRKETLGKVAHHSSSSKGTPIVFAETDLASGLLDGDVMQLTFSGGIGVLENPVVPLEEPAQLQGLGG